ncbi:hypothetical protein C8R44DRAFT_753177 [Mycena epipterygia]|nr:hypothetical protein C8R44DRAFT_753177 [Mycena epipterygia]
MPHTPLLAGLVALGRFFLFLVLDFFKILDPQIFKYQASSTRKYRRLVGLANWHTFTIQRCRIRTRPFCRIALATKGASGCRLQAAALENIDIVIRLPNTWAWGHCVHMAIRVLPLRGCMGKSMLQNGPTSGRLIGIPQIVFHDDFERFWPDNNRVKGGAHSHKTLAAVQERKFGPGREKMTFIRNTWSDIGNGVIHFGSKELIQGGGSNAGVIHGGVYLALVDQIDLSSETAIKEACWLDPAW